MTPKEATHPERYGVGVAVRAVRYGIPAALILAGQIILIATSDPVSWAGFTGAGLAVLLIGALLRIGIEGDRERHREEAAREYFSKHGRWPGEDSVPGRRD
jgi:hypothetical protein